MGAIPTNETLHPIPIAAELDVVSSCGRPETAGCRCTKYGFQDSPLAHRRPLTRQERPAGVSTPLHLFVLPMGLNGTMYPELGPLQRL